MSAVADLFAAWAPLTHRIAQLLWEISWQVGVLVVLVWLIALASRRSSAAFRYGLWCVVLLRLCLPVYLILPIGLSNTILPRPAPPLVSPQPAPAIEQPQPAAPEAIPRALPPAAFTPEPAGHLVKADYNLLGIVWLTVVVLLGVALAWRTRRVGRIVQNLPPVTRPELIELMGDLMRGAGITTPVELRAAPGSIESGGPMVIGIGRPTIILPREMAETWALEDLEPVLAHEVAHVRRRDILINWLQTIVQIAYFFHPLVWLANAQIRRERELACDDLAVAQLGGRRADYSRSILRVIETTQNALPMAAGIGMAERHSSLGRRIVRIMDHNYRAYRKMSALSFALMIVLGTVCIVLASERTKAADTEIDAKTRAIGEEVHKRITTYSDIQTFTIPKGGSVDMKLKPNAANVAALRVKPTVQPDGTVFELTAIDKDGHGLSDEVTTIGPIRDNDDMRTGVNYPGDLMFKVQLKPARQPDGSVKVEVKALFAKLPTFEEQNAMLMTQGKEGQTFLAFQSVAIPLLTYQTSHSRWPESLDKIKMTAPKDPYSPAGDPIHYEAQRTRFILSSCGEDGVYGTGDDLIYIGNRSGTSSGERRTVYPLQPEAASGMDAQEETLGTSGRRPKGDCLLAGKVVDAQTSEAVTNARVHLYNADTQDSIFVSVAGDGSFVYKAIPAGHYNMRVINTSGYQDEAYNPEGVKDQQLPQFTLKGREERTGVVFRLKRANSITGRVLNENGRPVGMSQVVAWGKSLPGEGQGEGYQIVGQTMTTPDGNYTFDRLDGRPVYVSFADLSAQEKEDPYPVRYYPGTFSRDEAKLITFDNTSSHEGIDIQLTKKGGIVLEGVVTDEAGAPVPKTLIVAQHQDMLFDRVTAYTDDKGQYRMEGLGPGALTVHADASPWNYALTRKPIDLKAGSSSARLDFVLNKGVTISGAFVDESGKTLAVVGQNTYGCGETKGAAVAKGSYSGVANRFGPKLVGNKSFFFEAGDGNEARVAMVYPSKSTFTVMGMKPGQELLKVNLYTADKQVLAINYQGQNVKETGIATKAGDKIEGVQIVLGPKK